MDYPLLSAKHLQRSVENGASGLLQQVCLDLFPGERVVLTGPSGSGKSLLLRALVRLDPMSTGRILFRGKSVSSGDVLSFRRHVTYVPQRPVLFNGDVETNLRAPFRLNSLKGQHFDPALAITWFEQMGKDSSFLHRGHQELSGGEAQLVALIRSLQIQPNVLLLDEPTAALDPDSARRVEAWLTQWVEAKPAERAYLWVSHDAEQAARIATRMLHMESGQLAEEHSQ